MRALYFRFFIETVLFPNVCLSCQLPAIVSYTYFTTNGTFATIHNSTTVVKSEDNNKVLVENQQIPILCPSVFKVFAKTTFKSFREWLQEENTQVLFVRCNISTIEPGRYVLKGVLGNLKITGNKIAMLRYGIFNNMAVRELNLSYNNVGIIESKAFQGNPYLQYLILKGNALQYLDPLWFKNIVNIKSVNMAENRLTELKRESFSELIDKAISINLAYNKLVVIEDGVFSGMKNIDSLLLQGNNISSLPGTFFTNVSFYILHLGSNQLSELPKSFYSYERDCSNLYVNNNNFSCETLFFLEECANCSNDCKTFKKTKIFYDSKKCTDIGRF